MQNNLIKNEQQISLSKISVDIALPVDFKMYFFGTLPIISSCFQHLCYFSSFFTIYFYQLGFLSTSSLHCCVCGPFFPFFFYFYFFFSIFTKEATQFLFLHVFSLLLTNSSYTTSLLLNQLQLFSAGLILGTGKSSFFHNYFAV